MIEVTILNYLNSVLSDRVYMQRPAKEPKRYYLMELTGSSLDNTVFTSTLAIQSCAPTLYEAAEMSWSVVDAMRDAVSLDEVSKVDLNTNYNFTDPETKRSRYQAVFDLVHY